MQISFALHTVGLVLWIGGLILLPRVMKGLCGEGAPSTAMVSMIPRIFFGYVVPGFAIVLVSGLFQFFIGGGPAVYMKQGWFHGKLTFVILLVVATALLAFEVNKLKVGEALNRGKLAAIHGLSAASLVLIVFLTFVGR